MKSEQQQEVQEEKRKKKNERTQRREQKGICSDVPLDVRIKSGQLNVFLMASEGEEEHPVWNWNTERMDWRCDEHQAMRMRGREEEGGTRLDSVLLLDF